MQIAKLLSIQVSFSIDLFILYAFKKIFLTQL